MAAKVYTLRPAWTSTKPIPAKTQDPRHPSPSQALSPLAGGRQGEGRNTPWEPEANSLTALWSESKSLVSQDHGAGTQSQTKTPGRHDPNRTTPLQLPGPSP